MKQSMGRWVMIPALGLLTGVVAAGETPVKSSPSPVFAPGPNGGVSGKSVPAAAGNATDAAAKAAPAAPMVGAESGIRLPATGSSPALTEPATQTARSGDATKPSPERSSALNEAMGGNADGVRLAPLAGPPPGVVTKENDAPAEDYRRPKYYAVTRPADKPLRVGRLFGSCSCIKVEAMTPTTLAAGKDGQVVLRVRIVKEPPAGVELLMVTAQVIQPSEDILTLLMNPLE